MTYCNVGKEVSPGSGQVAMASQLKWTEEEQVNSENSFKREETHRDKRSWPAMLILCAVTKRCQRRLACLVNVHKVLLHSWGRLASR